MKNNYFFILFILLFFLSCKREHSPVLQKIGVTTFNTGFFSFNFEHKGKLVYFGDLKTRKTIVAHSIESPQKQVLSINVDSISMNTGLDFCDFSVLSEDTLALLSCYVNIVTIVNSKGVVLYQKDYSDYLEEKQIRLPKSFNFTKEGLLFRSDYFGELDTITLVSFLSFNAQKIKDVPTFLIDRNIKSSDNNVEFFAPNFFNRLGDSTDYFLGTLNTKWIEGKLFFSTCYSDSIYQYSFENNKIKANSFECGIEKKSIPSTKITKANLINQLSTINENFRNYNQIRSFDYDSISEKYLVNIGHPWSDTDRIIDCTFVILNKDFSFYNEIFISGKEYNAGCFFFLNGELYVLNTDNGENNVSFTKFRIN